jgi:hypothetical protein
MVVVGDPIGDREQPVDDARTSASKARGRRRPPVRRAFAASTSMGRCGSILFDLR